MVKRGSITVFLALTLGLILSLLSSGLESARMAAARTQILNGMDIGLYSLFGQYNKSFLKDFDLFAVDGACGGKEMNLASIYDNLESYMKPVMKQNSQKLSVQQGGISGYLLMTDSEGEVFYQQAVQYMKETLGSHGAKLLLNKIQNMQKKTIEAERQGNEIESKGTIENYESEMDTAQQKSQALLEEKKKLLATIRPQYIIIKPSLHGGICGGDEWIMEAEKQHIGWWITSALESNIGLNAIAHWCATFNNPLPQGLGTGMLFTDNIEVPLEIRKDCLWFCK